jgi:hypothetical protein
MIGFGIDWEMVLALQCHYICVGLRPNNQHNGKIMVDCQYIECATFVPDKLLQNFG